MKLYSYWRSSAAYRVRIALNLKALKYELIPTHLIRNGGEHRLPDYLALNPQGLVPTLEHNGNVISQSLTIIAYLDEIFPTPSLSSRNTSLANHVIKILCRIQDLRVYF